jgi:hypothetical protein
MLTSSDASKFLAGPEVGSMVVDVLLTEEEIIW